MSEDGAAGFAAGWAAFGACRGVWATAPGESVRTAIRVPAASVLMASSGGRRESYRMLQPTLTTLPRGGR